MVSGSQYEGHLTADQVYDLLKASGQPTHKLEQWFNGTTVKHQNKFYVQEQITLAQVIEHIFHVQL